MLVQTLAPDAEAIGFAARHDADGFLAERVKVDGAAAARFTTHLSHVLADPLRMLL